MEIKLSELLHADIVKDDDEIDIFLKEKSIFIQRDWKYDTNNERLQYDALLYSCENCSSDIVVYFFEDKITKCISDGCIEIKNWKFPEICNQCRDYALDLLFRRIYNHFF